MASRLSPMITVILSYFSFIEKKKNLYVSSLFMDLSKGHCVPFENQWELGAVQSSRISVPGKRRQEDQEFKVSFDYKRLCFFL